MADNPEAARVLRSQQSIQRTLTAARRADVALVGIGNLDPATSGFVKAGVIRAEALAELRAQGAIGELNGMVTHFVAKLPYDLKNRFYDANLGAGVLLDTGSYCISWAYQILGQPEQVVSLAHFGASGVDYRSAYILKYAAASWRRSPAARRRTT